MRNETINFKRSKLAWVMAILYVLGVALAIYTAIRERKIIFSLSEFIQCSWIPINFVMIPFLIFSMNVGKSNNEIFESIDISSRDKTLSKVFAVGTIGGVLLITNIIIFIVIAIVCKVSIGYFLYNGIGYVINTMVVLIACGAIGLFIGQVISKKIGDVLAFIILIVAFIALCNFYKFRNFIIPIYNTRQFPSAFDIFNYDKTYFYHNILWLILSYMIFKIAFYKEYKREKSKSLGTLATIGICLGLSVALIINLHSLLPDFLDIGRNISAPLESKEIDIRDSFRNEKEKQYYPYKYNMDIDLDTNLKNSCEIEIKILQDKVNSLEFGLFHKLNISHVEIDGSKLNYKRTDKSFIVDLPKEYKNGDIVKLKVDYEGDINTVWGYKVGDKWASQYQQLFYVKKDLLALGGAFDWYPKQNDGRKKEYTLNVRYNSKNKLYSNLQGTYCDTAWKFQGNDKEIVLVSGHNIKEREYKGIVFVGNEEYINSNKVCDVLIRGKERAQNTPLKEGKKFIQVPLDYYIGQCYDSVYIYDAQK